MADQQITPLSLRWQRLPDGRLLLALSLPVQLKPGETSYIDLHRFALTQEEEDSLRAMLLGLVMAKSMPKANGHQKLQIAK